MHFQKIFRGHTPFTMGGETEIEGEEWWKQGGMLHSRKGDGRPWWFMPTLCRAAPFFFQNLNIITVYKNCGHSHDILQAEFNLNG